MPPTAESTTVADTIESNAVAGRKRITAAWVIEGKKAQGKHDVFLSHNSEDKAEVEKIANQLLKVGIRPWLDKWDLIPGEIASATPGILLPWEMRINHLWTASNTPIIMSGIHKDDGICQLIVP